MWNSFWMLRTSRRPARAPTTISRCPTARIVVPVQHEHGSHTWRHQQAGGRHGTGHAPRRDAGQGAQTATGPREVGYRVALGPERGEVEEAGDRRRQQQQAEHGPHRVQPPSSSSFEHPDRMSSPPVTTKTTGATSRTSPITVPSPVSTARPATPPWPR